MGKTSLINRYLGKGFPLEYTPTLGSDFQSKQVSLDTEYGPKDIRFQIWDLAGQPAFDQVRRLYYKGSAGAFIVFDLTRPRSLENMERWLKEFSKNIELPSASIIVLGNKMDLIDEIKISFNTVRDHIDNNLVNKYSNIDSQIEYYSTSAKDGTNVDYAFSALGEMIITKLYQ
ncbi:MAG: GTP-binding protein [Candidatus Heimdallarchaeota archaeon]|nr:MAG: GTP-binding protein [Candidatus Heimdallarchaeota archaeon]